MAQSFLGNEDLQLDLLVSVIVHLEANIHVARRYGWNDGLNAVQLSVNRVLQYGELSRRDWQLLIVGAGSLYNVLVDMWEAYEEEEFGVGEIYLRSRQEYYTVDKGDVVMMYDTYYEYEELLWVLIICWKRCSAA